MSPIYLWAYDVKERLGMATNTQRLKWLSNAQKHVLNFKVCEIFEHILLRSERSEWGPVRGVDGDNDE